MLEVRTLLADPRTGRVRYGQLSTLIEDLLSKWVSSQQVSA